LNRLYILPFLIIFLTGLPAACTSSEKKVISSDIGKEMPVRDAEVREVDLEGSSVKNRVTFLKLPSDYTPPKPEVITFSSDDVKVTLFAKSFAQGSGVYAEIEKKGGGSDPAGVTLFFKNIKVPVTGTSWGFRALWGIDPQQKPGSFPVVVNYNINGKDSSVSTEIKIRFVDFPVSKTMLNVGKFSDKNYTTDPKFKDLIAECSALRSKAFSSVTEDSIGSSLAYPRDSHKITGDYWRKRIYLSYEKKGKKKVIKEGRPRFHRGVDLRGAVGAPIYAMADGLVVLSHSMFFEGKMVVIDHGNQVFSYYQHMDSLAVKAGDSVKAGDFIGGVGDTGMVTGPHLHLAFSIRGVHVDPLSILSLPVRR
jgi:murein DD-endopeptidase MepM/ murein hydrolase activator NlpD